MVNRLSRMIIGAPSVDRERLSRLLRRQRDVKEYRPHRNIGLKAPDFNNVVVADNRSPTEINT